MDSLDRSKEAREEEIEDDKLGKSGESGSVREDSEVARAASEVTRADPEVTVVSSEVARVDPEATRAGSEAARRETLLAGNWVGVVFCAARLLGGGVARELGDGAVLT